MTQICAAAARAEAPAAAATQRVQVQFASCFSIGLSLSPPIVTRANALEDNVRLYHVVKGDRRQFAGWNGKVASGKWHELAVEAQGDRFQVFFDGQKIIDAHDKTFTDAGKFGVWTKADSVIQFDDLTATPR